MLTTRRSATDPVAAVAGAVAADPVAWAAADGRAPAWSGVAHSEQNFADGGLIVPQLGQPPASGVAHSEQNFAPGRFSVAQVGQITGASIATSYAGLARQITSPNGMPPFETQSM